MNAVLEIIRKRIWWILLALVIFGALFFRPSILGFKEGAGGKTPKPKKSGKGKQGGNSNNSNT